MKHTRMPETHCPYCNKELDTAGSFECLSPIAGDITVCISCGGLAEFDDDLMLIKASEESISECDPSELKKIKTIINQRH